MTTANPQAEPKSDHVYDLARFRKEACEFRKIITDKRNTLDYMDRAYGCLALIYFRVEKKYEKEVMQLWEMISEEWSRRKMLLILGGHPIE